MKITINVDHWYKGHRDNLTYGCDGPRALRQNVRVDTRGNLVSIARAMRRLLRAKDVRFQLRTVSGGKVKIEAFAQNRQREGRPAYAVVWHLVSPLPGRLQIGKFSDYTSGLPELLEDREFYSLKHFENQVEEAGISDAQFVQRRPRKTDWDRRFTIGHRFMLLAMRCRRPPTLHALRKAFEVARASAKAVAHA